METKMKTYILSIFALILTGAFVLSMSGCQTMDGVGKDMSHAGDEISEEAREHDDD
jgi:predicted small secreted protein